MKACLFVVLMFSASLGFAEDAGNEWHDTVLKEDTIQRIQQSQFHYKKCVSDTMQKPDYAKMDSRNATDIVIKECEPVLAEMRQVYLDSNVPEVIADRHLKKMRIQITRKVLQELLFAEAARAQGAHP